MNDKSLKAGVSSGLSHRETITGTHAEQGMDSHRPSQKPMGVPPGGPMRGDRKGTKGHSNTVGEPFDNSTGRG